MNSVSPADREVVLLNRIAAGDRHAFEELYHQYHQRLFGFLFKVTHRPDLVEEVLNDVMFTVWTDAGRFAGRSRPSTWIFGIAHHKAMHALRRHAVELEDESELREEVSAEILPERRALHRELAEELGRAVSALSPQHRAVVELTYYEEFSYPEIAEILGCPVNTVKTRMFHARRRLRELLGSGAPWAGSRS